MADEEKKPEAKPDKKQEAFERKKAAREAAQKKFEEDSKAINAPDWLMKMAPLDIMALPFGYINYTGDFYEVALKMLQLKKWGFFKFLIFYFLFLSPILWPPFFRYPERLQTKNFIFRYFVLFCLMGIFYFGLLQILTITEYLTLFKPALLLTIAAFVTVHFLAAYDPFRKWRRAFLDLHKKP